MIATLVATLGAVASAVGAVGVIAALWFSGRQTRAVADQLALQIAQHERSINASLARLDLDLNDRMMQFDRMFFEHPELRPYFYDGWPIPVADPDRSRVLATAEWFMDFADSVASMDRHGQLAPQDFEAWSAFLHTWYEASPAIRFVWGYWGDKYLPGTREILGADDPLLIHLPTPSNGHQ